MSSGNTIQSQAPHRIAALVFDLDGTLYKQSTVRIRMLRRLAVHTLLRPGEMLSAWRALAAYRRAQETLRVMCSGCSSIAEEQLEMACRSTGLSRDSIARYVSEWMEEAPLDLLAPAMRDGVPDLLRMARQSGLRLAVWSDYPAAAKLKAMRLDDYFDVVLSAQDRELQRLKPDPRGLEIILSRLGVTREETIYIGDRPEVDGWAAAAAGVECFIIGGQRAHSHGAHWQFVSSHREIMKMISSGLLPK